MLNCVNISRIFLKKIKILLLYNLISVNNVLDKKTFRYLCTEKRYRTML